MNHIFIVEDDKEIARNLKLLLQAEGFTAATAPTKAAAAQMIEQDTFDLALVDISLPDGNGYTVCTQIKQVQDIPVIFLTGRRDPESMIKVMPLNPSGYLLKNSKPGDIKKEIDTFMQKLREKKEK